MRSTRPDYISYFVEHRDIIERFGRFPAPQSDARPRDDAGGTGLSRRRRLRRLTAARLLPPVAAGRQPLDARRVDSGQMIRQRLAAGDEIRRDLGERRQHEGALAACADAGSRARSRARCGRRRRECRCRSARPPALRRSRFSARSASRQSVEQRARRVAGRDLGRGVEEIGLVGLAPGRRAVERRDRDDLASADRRRASAAPRPSTWRDRRDCRRGRDRRASSIRGQATVTST